MNILNASYLKSGEVVLKKSVYSVGEVAFVLTLVIGQQMLIHSAFLTSEWIWLMMDHCVMALAHGFIVPVLSLSVQGKSVG